GLAEEAAAEGRVGEAGEVEGGGDDRSGGAGAQEIEGAAADGGELLLLVEEVALGAGDPRRRLADGALGHPRGAEDLAGDEVGVAPAAHRLDDRAEDRVAGVGGVEVLAGFELEGEPLEAGEE